MLAAAVLLVGADGGSTRGTQAPFRPATPVVSQKVRPLPLQDVRVTGGPLKRAQDLDAQYLLSLEPDRMMAFLRKSAGLEPKAEGYNGWDGPGRQLTGHIAGHYLSAVSLMYAATGDPRFKERADYLVRELKAVQDGQGDGYIGAQADRDGVDGKVRIDGARERGHPLRRLRPQRPVVAVVRPPQDLRGAARRLPPGRQPRGARGRGEVCRVGRGARWRSSMPTRLSGCWPRSSAG